MRVRILKEIRGLVIGGEVEVIINPLTGLAHFFNDKGIECILQKQSYEIIVEEKVVAQDPQLSLMDFLQKVARAVAHKGVKSMDIKVGFKK